MAMTPEELKASRMAYIPAAERQTANRFAAKAGAAEGWTWIQRGTLCAVVFLGASSKPYSGGSSPGSSYRFRTQEGRGAFIAKAFECAAYQAKRKAERKAEDAAQRAAGHGLKVGDVMRSMWGYEQTNVDFYEVVALVGTTMVEARRIACQSLETMSMQGKCVPAPGEFVGEAKRYRATKHGIKVGHSYASRLEYQTVAGVRVYPASCWTSYA